MSWLTDAERRAEKATEGPWEWHRDTYYKSVLTAGGGGWDTTFKRWSGVHILHEPTDGPSIGDAEFIASARTDLPRALALVRELGEALARYERRNPELWVEREAMEHYRDALGET